MCPWCGRDMVLLEGVLPRHKALTAPHPVTGALRRGWCAGGGELPALLSPEDTRQLRGLWRDAGGQLIEGDEQ